MSTAYRVGAWLLVALGVLQIASTPSFFHGLTTSALYFASSGFTLMLTGTLNLLNRTYGQDAAGVRWVSRSANVVMLGFIAVEGVVDRADVTQLVIVVGLLGGVTALSLAPTALTSRSTSRAA